VFFLTKQGTKQDDSPPVATVTTLYMPVLSTLFEISRVVYQSLLFNDGTLIIIRDNLFLFVSMCVKKSDLQNLDSNR
jgi:hypothetical protein